MSAIIKSRKCYFELKFSNGNALMYGYVNMIDKHSWSLFRVTGDGLSMSSYLSLSGMDTDEREQLVISGIDLL